MNPLTVEHIRDIIEEHASRGGMVDVRGLWRELDNLPMEPLAVQEIVRGLERTGYLWCWGDWMVLVRRFQCPECNRVVEERVSRHMDECDGWRKARAVKPS